MKTDPNRPSGHNADPISDTRNEAGPASSPLAGIRVVDLTTVVFGPSATQTLGDYGADVIKVEPPEGDSTRSTGASAEAGMAALFLGSNRNKRSMVLDIKTEAGRAALLALVDTADVFIHNMRPQKLAALGIAPEQLRARNKRLIYVGLHGFGNAGPYSGRPAYDDVIQALSGVADLNLRQGADARYFPSVVADKVAGQMAVHATLAALFQRERTGEGQFVEVPMFECFVQFLLTEHFYQRHVRPSGTDNPPEADDFGYPRSLAPWRRPYKTTDGRVCFMPYSDQNWRDFFHAANLPHFVDDPRFLSLSERTKNIAALYEILESVVATASTDHWLTLGEQLGIPCAPVNMIADLESDPHIAAVNLIQTMPTGSLWDMRYIRSPIHLSASDVQASCPPRLGQHTAELMDELGLS